MKVVINGEPFDWDSSKMPMAEALWIEHVYQRRYAEWNADLAAGSAKAMGMLACLIWRRDGRDVPLQDVLDGTVDLDLMEMIVSMGESAEAEERAAAEAEAEAAAAEVPTQAGPGPAGTPGTSPATSASSPKPSATRRKR